MFHRKKVVAKQKKFIKMPKVSVAAKEKEKEKPSAPVLRISKTAGTPSLLRGMKDILPVEAPYWFWLRERADALAKSFGYHFIETPILEPTELFLRSVGRQTDIIEKEMYHFVDPGGENVCLRPEATASIARAYISHGMLNLPQPVKLFYYGPMFRHDRPQAGRYRGFHQIGFEVFGDEHSVVDAELISLVYTFFKELGIATTIQLNSIGCDNCRQNYKVNLQNYYRLKRSLICQTCKDRLTRNPMRLLDCKEIGCEAVKDGAPQMMDNLCEACHNHFFKVIEYLDALSLPYALDPYLVRGLDYYSRTVFEIWPQTPKNNPAPTENPAVETPVKDDTLENNEEEVKGAPLAQGALAGGGRYDKLVEILGGRPTPGAGFALGMERVIRQLRAQNVEPPIKDIPQVFIAQLGEQAKCKALALFSTLRGEIAAQACMSKDSLKAQLEIANRLGVHYVVIIGQKEVLDGTVIIRDMKSGTQETVVLDKMVEEVKKRLK